ncbi:hypothetical protein [Paraburkholderia acidicola]|uniref:hypothetical protein n=1 Tax=Paraburkholderia acidicola TaxID=1912599 RepID=UPI0032DF2904
MLRGAVGGFIAIAAAAVFTTFEPRVGGWHAILFALVALVALAIAAVRQDRGAPGLLKIGPDSLTVWNRRGALLCQGRIAGCSQWSGRLLMLVLVGDDGRSHPLLLAADALPDGVFRELAVLGRCGAGARL